MNNIWTQAALAAPGSPSEEGSELSSEQGGTTTQQGANTATPPANEDRPATKTNPWWQMAPFFAILIIIYFFMLRGPKKKEQERQKMVQSLKKNDRVRTIGGIFGTVIDVRGDDITLKIDESNNTKIHVISGAIAAVLSDEAK